MTLTKMGVFDIIQKCKPNYFSFIDIKLLTDEVSKLLLIKPTDSLNEMLKMFLTDFQRKKSSVAKQSS